MMKSYLLGQLSAAEQESFEEEYFTNDNVFLELEEVECELIRSYLHERLDRRERALFEGHFLTLPGRRERVLCAAALDRLQSPPTSIDININGPQPDNDPENDRPAFLFSFLKPKFSAMFAVALASGLLFLCALIFIYRLSGLNGADSKQRASSAIDEAVKPPAADAAAAEKLSGATTTIKLTRMLARRGAGEKDVKSVQIDSSTAVCDLVLDIKGFVYQRFKGTIRKLEGVEIEISSQEGLKPRLAGGEKVVILQVDAKKLSPGQYEVTLEGRNDSGKPDHAYYGFLVRGPGFI